MRGIVAIAAACALVGCSIGALDGFSGGAGDPDAAANDATVGGDVTSTDGGANDGTVGDASTDAASDGGAFDCDGGAYLVCATFDQGLIASGWTGTRLAAGGTLGTSSEHRSPPYSMRAQLPVMTTEENQYAAVYESWPTVRGVRVSFDAWIAEPQWGSTDKAFALLHVQYPTSTSESYLFRAPTETTLSIEQNDLASRYQKVQDLPYAKWVRVTLEFVPTIPTGTLRLLYDGLVVFENTSIPNTAPSAPETLVDVGLARFTPPSPALDVLFDNVTIEQIP